jgi:hypothetical protein
MAHGSKRPTQGHGPQRRGATGAGGATSLRAIAAELPRRRGIPTPRGTGTWQAVQVPRIMAAGEA